MPVNGDSLNLAVGFFLSDRSLYLRPGPLRGMSVEERSEISASSPGVGDALARDPRPCDDPTPPPKTSAEGRFLASTSASAGCERSISVRSAGSPTFRPARCQPARSSHGVGEVAY